MYTIQKTLEQVLTRVQNVVLLRVETGVFISLKELSSGVYIINWRDSAIKIYK